jgi:transposase-like protein
MSKKRTRAADRGRFSSKVKAEAVVRLLRGEDLDALSRELSVTAATLASWRDAFLEAGQAALRSRGGSPVDDENQKLKALVGELTLEKQILTAAVKVMERTRPLALRRSKP